MRLKKISESKDNSKSYFHGTNNIQDVLKNGGLKLGYPRDKQNGFIANRSSIYLGSLHQATAYGKGIIEVLVDVDAIYHADEDALIHIADPNDPSWVEKNLINVPRNKIKLVHKATMEAGGWESWPSLSGKLPTLIQTLNIKLRPNKKTEGVTNNIAIPKEIGFDGDVKIIAGYQTKVIDKTDNDMSIYEVTDILYGKGTLDIGYKFKGASMNNFWVH